MIKRAAKTGEVKADGKGLRFNSGKTRVDLIPSEWPWALGRVMQLGAIKYATRNWEKGMKWSDVTASLLRHVFLFMMGERYDKETGCHHLAHAAWNCLALMSYDVRGLGEDDRQEVPVAVLDQLWEIPQEPAPKIAEALGLLPQKPSRKRKAA